MPTERSDRKLIQSASRVEARRGTGITASPAGMTAFEPGAVCDGAGLPTSSYVVRANGFTGFVGTLFPK